MNKHNALFVVSMLVLSGLIAATVLRPKTLDSTGVVSTAQSQAVDIMETPDRWILSLNLFNPDKDTYRYAIEVQVDNNLSKDEAILRSGRYYTYVQHIPKEGISKGQVKVKITRSGQDAPVELVYELKDTSK